MNESKKSAVPPCEQETTISFSRDSDMVDIWTSDTTMMTKLNKLCKNAPNDYKCIEVGRFDDNSIANKRYIINSKRLLSFRSAIKKRDITEEQRAELSQRMRDMNKSKSVDNSTDKL